MMTKTNDSDGLQGHLFKPLLRDIVSPRHAMVKLADTIGWQSFDDGLSECFCADNGRPSCPVKLMVALSYLKYASGMSDEAVLDEWLETPYWQYFTGGIYFEHEYPTNQACRDGGVAGQKRRGKNARGKPEDRSARRFDQKIGT
jgi:IS5 family transposase